MNLVEQEYDQAQGTWQSIIERFLKVRRVTEDLCAPLTVEDFMLSVTVDTSPIKWHLGHTSWFFEHFLLKAFHRDYSSFSNQFEFIFNSYYKSIGAHIPKSQRNTLSRPSVTEVFHYRSYVTERIYNLSQNSHIDQKSFFRILELGINHEEQHQELMLMDIKRNFFESPLRPQYVDASYLSSPLEINPRWEEVEGGAVAIGVSSESEKFAYDNEKDQHIRWNESFYLSSHLVTNEEYMQFIEDGGYEDPRLWLSDGWDFKNTEKWQAPLYWEKRDETWWNMTLSGMSPVEPTAPLVHISYYEAKAFAHWKGARLPTEFEWEQAALMEKFSGDFMDGAAFQPEASLNDHEFFSQIHGTVWEWTESAYLPYPRYRALTDGLAEYNEKFMCNQMVLRGGSCVTPRDHYRLTYRNFYYPHMRWQFAGLRLAKDQIL